MNICFATFGCRLNRAEAFDDEAWLLAQGHRIVATHREADVFVIRGCSVTARAQHDCEKLIRHLKRHYPNKRIVVTGCLPGASKNARVQLVPRYAAAGAVQQHANTDHAVPTRTARAYLKVQDGCAGKCTFCIVPKFRGAAVSEPFDDVLDKAKRFIDAGYHEVVVTGCNLSLYANGGKRLPDLLAALAELDAGCRIRLGSLEPSGCACEVVDVMGEHENVCRFLHLPVQSGSDRMLKAMKRPYAVKDVVSLVVRARKVMPFAMIGCDVMVGFPGEGEVDFIQTRNLLVKNNFANIHIFPYSDRPGTPASTMPHPIPHELRSMRAGLLKEVGSVNRTRFARRFVGREVDVIIESRTTQPKGWTSEYLWFEGPVRPSTPGKMIRKQQVRFVVRSVDGGILHGVPVTNGR